MEVVDLQVHAPGPFVDWSGADADTRARVLKEALKQMMDAVGVDAVVFNPVDEPQYALDLAAEEPNRFCINQLLVSHPPRATYGVTSDVEAPDTIDRLRAVIANPHVNSVRIFLALTHAPKEYAQYQAGRFEPVFRTCQELGFPVRLFVSGVLDIADSVASRYPNLQIIIDHFGLRQAPISTPDDPRWLDLPKLLALASYPNIAVQVTGAPIYSAQGYPYSDVRPYITKILTAFGVDRLAWASDISRVRGRTGWHDPLPGGDSYQGRHNYMESLAFWLYTDELSESEKAKVLGGTARRLLKWPG